LQYHVNSEKPKETVSPAGPHLPNLEDSGRREARLGAFGLWFAYVAVLVLLGYWYWPAPLAFDESMYYLPAIRSFAAALPHVTVDDYRMPNPPAALITQAIVFQLTRGNIAATRMVSSAAVAIIAALLLAIPACRDKTRLESSIAAAYVLLSPTLLNDAFILKHHTFSICGLVGGIWCLRYTEAKTRYVLASLFFSIAVLTSQVAVPFLGFLLLIESVPFARRRFRAPHARIVVAMVPLALLGLLFAVWGGAEPPSYRTVLLQSRIGHFNFRQVILCLYVLGLWFLPLRSHLNRRLLLQVVYVLPVACAAVYWTAVVDPHGNFDDRIVGPITTLLHVVTGEHYPLLLLLFSVPVAVGITFLIEEVTGDLWHGPIPYIAVFMAFMILVPYLFESYYVYLVVPWLVWDWERFTAGMRAVHFRVFALAICGMGISYAAIKIYRLIHGIG